MENNNISAKEGSNYCEQGTVSQRVHKTVTLGSRPSCNSYTVQVKWVEKILTAQSLVVFGFVILIKFEQLCSVGYCWNMHIYIYIWSLFLFRIMLCMYLCVYGEHTALYINMPSFFVFIYHLNTSTLLAVPSPPWQSSICDRKGIRKRMWYPVGKREIEPHNKSHVPRRRMRLPFKLFHIPSWIIFNSGLDTRPRSVHFYFTGM